MISNLSFWGFSVLRFFLLKPTILYRLIFSFSFLSLRLSFSIYCIAALLFYGPSSPSFMLTRFPWLLFPCFFLSSFFSFFFLFSLFSSQLYQIFLLNFFFSRSKWFLQRSGGKFRGYLSASEIVVALLAALRTPLRPFLQSVTFLWLLLFALTFCLFSFSFCIRFRL